MTNPLDRRVETLQDRYTLERQLGQGGMATGLHVHGAACTAHGGSNGWAGPLHPARCTLHECP